MPAGSLIFVVVVAIWAAYLLQHWSRRRENAAAARSVDGFTEAMRVLEKRPVLPRPDLAEPRPHSYSVTPARIVRTTVDVKRAAPAGVARQRSPLVARRHSDTEPGIDSAEVETMSPAAAPAQPRRRVSLARRRIRALLLLSALLWVPVSVVLALRGTILWVSVPFSVLTVVAVVVWLRTEAQADRVGRAGRGAGRRAGRGRPAAQPVLSSDDTQVIRQPHRYAADATPSAGPAHTTAHATAHPAVSAESAASPEPATARVSELVEASPAASDTVFDVAAIEPAPAARATPAEAAPGTWSPVPVPTPTYAMKAKAEPRYTADGIPADVFDTPEFADEVDELDDRALFARRAASQ